MKYFSPHSLKTTKINASSKTRTHAHTHTHTHSKTFDTMAYVGLARLDLYSHTYIYNKSSINIQKWDRGWVRVRVNKYRDIRILIFL